MLIALDLGGTKTIVAACDLSGNIITRKQADTPRTLKTGIELIKSLIGEVAGHSKIAAIGVSAGGPMQHKQGIISPLNMPEWRNIPLKEILQNQFSCPCRIEVDTDAAALAEYRFGKNQVSRLLYVTISTGVGGGLLLEGKIYRGRNDEHPEVGHQSIPHKLAKQVNIKCICGADNCLEAIVSGTAIRQIYGKPAQELNSLEWEEVGRNLGEGLRNLAHIYAPDTIVLGGGVCVGGGETFLNAARDRMQKQTQIISYPHLVISSLGYDTALFGALALALDVNGA